MKLLSHEQKGLLCFHFVSHISAKKQQQQQQTNKQTKKQEQNEQTKKHKCIVKVFGRNLQGNV